LKEKGGLWFFLKKYSDSQLNLKTSTPSYVVYGELGRYPIYIDIKIRTVCYWARVIVGKVF
jgi:hypothetical protein